MFPAQFCTISKANLNERIVKSPPLLIVGLQRATVVLFNAVPVKLVSVAVAP